MLAIADLSRRQRSDEIMDRPDLPAERHLAALRGLARINGLSGSAAAFWPAIAAVAAAHPDRPIRVLDVACGGGDVLCRLARLAVRRRLCIEWAGCDLSPRALEFAAARATAEAATIRFFTHDALHGPLPEGYDIAISSLFLHHLEDADAELLLRRMAATQRMLLINDLRRCRAGLLLAHLAGRLLTRSEVVRTDAVLSVRAAFTMGEVERMAERAGLAGAAVTARWPCRWLLRWERNEMQ